MVTDAAILSNISSGVLFVVRAGRTDQRGVQHAITQLEYANAKILGFVLNGVNADSGGYGYKRYGYRRYGYGYQRHGYQQYGYGYQAGQNPSAPPAEQGNQPEK